MVTIEDILEEIVGEIQDEFDEERPEVEEETDKSYSVDGKMLLEDVNDLFGLELDDSQCDTIGGWVYTQLNTQPQIGQTVKLPKAEITVETLSGIKTLQLYPGSDGKVKTVRVNMGAPILQPEQIPADIHAFKNAETLKMWTSLLHSQSA